MHPFRKPLATLAAALALSACGPQEPAPTTETPAVTEDSRTPAQSEAQRTPYELDAAFAKAGADFGVPADLLKGISYTETRWEMIQGNVEFEGVPAAYGLMALRGAKLSEGARLAGVSEEAVRTQPEANIRAAAALLSSYANELKVDRADLGSWASAAAKYSGIDNTDAQAQYIHQGVYDVIRKGAVAQTPKGDLAVSLMPNQVHAKFASPSVHAMSADYAPAIWRASPNYNARPAGTDVSLIVIHTCEGTYSSCWSWLTNTASGVSAHYVVNESGSEISQLVLESNRGWHVGATYDCGLNGSVMCGLNGTSVNNFSVGIEHGGSASQASFPAGQIDASAKLSCDISLGQGIVRDSYHIVAHGRLQPASRTDPGANWPWSTYISKIKSYCGDSTGSSIIIDSNQANNDTSKGYVEVVGTSWTSSTNVAGYYGSGYYASPTAAVSEPVTFWFNMPAAGTKTIDAWWTAATDRSTTAPFIITHSGGTQTVQVNQQANGGKWNTLGTWSFPAGWNKVQLSRWTTSGYYVIADAIQVR
ncbi:golvesin C-terminal-like domain-containing protein [Archangium lansingense]|uniref:N-acetylmuramoyl-L-alanine amidase n=1 Tax=Archangium lansingense TaxID=2995310 RepID=A0ABT3ZVG7_9BACT|nr:N-acetylmuramoyl-L-alanine amidase [Archangium lansinium]MCY1073385.1 N-acetylmuramoyl-L-alanine amidase [Archangium lansinium]